MYSYSCLPPGEGLWPPLQPLTYTYLPTPLLLPPIQSYNFCSPPPSLNVGEWAAPREYHLFYGPRTPLAAAGPWWAFPQAYAAALRPPFPAVGYRRPAPQPPSAEGPADGESGARWPEGGSLQAELRWGHVERALGPRFPLPDYVRRELRRVYGTFPHTDVRITYRRGEFLLQAAPRVREPESRVERRVARRPASSGGDSGGRDSGDGDSNPFREAAQRGRGKRKKDLG
ncbi:uncharacterized protein C10orf95 homolog isoform X2 [Dasypus novemcinctus]|uniref:uncharacterized protein C10orf95 homolog isoform X2 n=1 Tax=Dasypus novemcinctus TaxID=9361 RepID=UPI0026605A84|nr:uncharacterized protein C10orf95 homolog isoform X2 [Dasypus novemcinctus]